MSQVSSGVAPVGVEEGDGGGGGVEGDEGGRQGPSQAPGQKAPPWYHLQTSKQCRIHIHCNALEREMREALGAGSMMQSLKFTCFRMRMLVHI